VARYTANEFKQNKRQEAFNEAYKGEEVIINHDRYKDVEFILSTRKREALRLPILNKGVSDE
jgi:hypothetical protein